VNEAAGSEDELVCLGDGDAGVAVLVERDRDVGRRHGRRVALDEDDLERNRDRCAVGAAGVRDGAVRLVDDVAHHVTDGEGDLEDRRAVLRVHSDGGVVAGRCGRRGTRSKTECEKRDEQKCQ